MANHNSLTGKRIIVNKFGSPEQLQLESFRVPPAPKGKVRINSDPEQSIAVSWGLYFHPDLIRNTHLAEKMKDYTFFDYDAHEALHISDQEKKSSRGLLRSLRAKPKRTSISTATI